MDGEYITTKPPPHPPPLMSNTKVRKGSYILAVIETAKFVQQKETIHRLDCGAYFIKKEYKGTPTSETCALLGIPVGDVYNFIIEHSDYIQLIRNDKQLDYIEDIGSLTCKYLHEAIYKFKNFFNLYAKEQNQKLLLLNIEPKGHGRHQRFYPIPRITIPGGRMESSDEEDFELCGIREFKEETGIDLTEGYKRLSREKLKKGYRFTHFPSSKPSETNDKFKYYFLKNKMNEDPKSVNMYYLVEIK